MRRGFIRRGIEKKSPKWKARINKPSPPVLRGERGSIIIVMAGLDPAIYVAT
jgi:hypothetical protein